MLTPNLLIFERRPRWVPELERQFAGQNVRVRGCRSLKDVENRLHTDADCVVILELEAAAEECLHALTGLMARYRSPTILVVASEPNQELEWSVRELGATEFLIEPIPGEEMALRCQRLFPSIDPTNP